MVLLVKFLQHSDLRRRLLDTDSSVFHNTTTIPWVLVNALKRLRNSFLPVSEAKLSNEEYHNQAIEVATARMNSIGYWPNTGWLIREIFT